MKYDYNKKINRKLSKCRKWDNQILKEKFNLNSNAIPMDLADLDFECAPAIKEALVNRAALGDYGYTYAYDEYYDSIISWNKRRFNVTLKKEWIKLTFGTCGTLHYLVQCFCDKGDAVMINTPAYDPFAEAIESGDCRIVCNPLKNVNNRYEFDFELMEQQIKNEHVKMYILCSPQNPSGRVWTKEELARLSKICLENQVLLISDEIHRDIIFDRASFTTLWNVDDYISDYSITCISPNKGFNLGGLKSSYVVIKNDKLRDKFLRYLKKVYITSPHVFVVPALIAAYDSDEWLDGLTNYISDNFAILYEWFEKNIPAAKVMRSDASFLAWIDMRDVFDSEAEMIQFFTQANIAVVKGSYFVQDGEGWVRINIGTQKSILLEALARMRETYLTWNK